nr:immunoglobulin heavy chain junction region [Mus musculus]
FCPVGHGYYAMDY